MNTAIQVAPLIGIGVACLALGVARATFYRARRAVSARRPRAWRVASPRALSASERHTILEGVPRFLLRGLPKVRGEFALSVLTYNLKRVINILGVRTLLARLKAVAAPLPAPLE